MTAQLKYSPLYTRHHAAGAIFVDFAGWQMPLRYSSQQQEHLQVRSNAGMFDVSHMLAVDITGNDARALCRKVLSNDIDSVIKPGGAIYGCMLNSSGGVVDDTIWLVFAENHLVVVLNAGCREQDLDWLKQHAQGLKVKIKPRQQHGIIAVQGPNAGDLVAQALPAFSSANLAPMQARLVGTSVVSRTGYTGEDGLELIVSNSQLAELWDELIKAGVTPCGLGARNTLRLEAAMPLYGHELSANISPLEAGISWCVNFSDPERQFIGRDWIAKQKKSNQHRKQVGLLLKKPGVLRDGYSVTDKIGKEIGIITSGGFSPSIKGSIGLAMLDAGIAVKPADSLAVTIRGQSLPVEVVKPPFVRKGKVLISLLTI